MIKHIHPQQELIYYDGLQLFVGNDQLQTSYICLLIDSGPQDIFMCVPISKTRLNKFYNGDLDLRDIYTSPETGEWFQIGIDNYQQDYFVLEPIDEPNESYLPSAGFLLTRTGSASQSIVIESKEKNRAIVHLSLNPPEALAEPKIHSFRLAEVLGIFQTLVREAYHKSIREDKKSANYREILSNENQYQLDVYATAPGSFTVQLQSEALSDLLGYSEIAKAFDRIDIITANILETEKAVATIAENKGRVATAYLKLLNFIVDNDSPISYQWTMPEKSEPIYYSIPKKQAIDLRTELLKIEDISKEIMRFTGKFTKVDIKRKTWSVTDETENRTYTGHIPKDSEVSLLGVTIGTQLYSFICEEKIIELAFLGKEQTNLLLIEFHPIP
jgi:hypothetical protein